MHAQYLQSHCATATVPLLLLTLEGWRGATNSSLPSRMQYAWPISFPRIRDIRPALDWNRLCDGDRATRRDLDRATRRRARAPSDLSDQTQMYVRRVICGDVNFDWHACHGHGRVVRHGAITRNYDRARPAAIPLLMLHSRWRTCMQPSVRAAARVRLRAYRIRSHWRTRTADPLVARSLWIHGGQVSTCRHHRW